MARSRSVAGPLGDLLGLRSTREARGPTNGTRDRRPAAATTALGSARRRRLDEAAPGRPPPATHSSAAAGRRNRLSAAYPSSRAHHDDERRPRQGAGRRARPACRSRGDATATPPGRPRPTRVPPRPCHPLDGDRRTGPGVVGDDLGDVGAVQRAARPHQSPPNHSTGTSRAAAPATSGGARFVARQSQSAVEAEEGPRLGPERARRGDQQRAARPRRPARWRSIAQSARVAVERGGVALEHEPQEARAAVGGEHEAGRRPATPASGAGEPARRAGTRRRATSSPRVRAITSQPRAGAQRRRAARARVVTSTGQRLPRRPAGRVEVEVGDLAAPDQPGPRVVGERRREQQREHDGDRRRTPPTTQRPTRRCAIAHAGEDRSPGPSTQTRTSLAAVPPRSRRDRGCGRSRPLASSSARAGRGRRRRGRRRAPPRRRRARPRRRRPETQRLGADHDVDRARAAARRREPPSSHSTVAAVGDAGQHLGRAEELGDPAATGVGVDLLRRTRPARPRRRASPRPRRPATAPPAGRGSRAARWRRPSRRIARHLLAQRTAQAGVERRRTARRAARPRARWRGPGRARRAGARRPTARGGTTGPGRPGRRARGTPRPGRRRARRSRRWRRR